MIIERFLKAKQGTVVDVRTPEEYDNGYAVGSVNIPLQQFIERIEEIKSLNQPLILCCASGIRSEKAGLFLKKLGIECYNAGCWLDVE